MARRLVFEIVGDDASAQQAFRRTDRSVNSLQRDVGKAFRGVAAGSGIFRSLGRTLAFASGGFLAFASGADFLRKSVDQAREALVTQKQLAAQFRASGQALGPYQKQIDATTSRLSVLAGFDDDELKAAFTTIFRSTRDVSKGLRDTGLAADIARARHISLASAGTLVAKVEAGNIGLLRRMGVQVAKNATVEQALAAARARFAGQAAAGTTAQERFGAVLQNTEQVIGTALLPTIDKYLASGTKWLQQMDQSGELQKDVANAAQTVNHVVSDGVAIIRTAKSGIEAIDHVTGSFENTLKAVASTWLLLKIRTKAIQWGVIASGERLVGTSATIAAGEVTGLEGALTRLKGLGPVGVAVALSFVPQAASSKNPEAFSNNPAAKGFAKLPVVGPLFSQANRLADYLNGLLGITPSAAPKSAFTGGQNAFAPGGSLNAVSILQQAANQSVANTLKGAAKKHLSLLGQFNLLELKLADAERTNNTVLQRSILVSEEGILLQLRDQAKTLSKRTGYAQQAASVASQIRSIDQAAASAAKKQVDAVKKAAKKSGDFQVPLVLQVAQARAEALGLTGTERSVLEKIKAVAQKALRSHKSGLQAQLEEWQTIGQVNDQLNNGAQHALTRFRHVSTAVLAKQLGITGADNIRNARLVLAQVGAGSTVPPHRSPAFAGGGGSVGGTRQRTLAIYGGLHLHGVQNVRQLEDELHKRARGRPSRRRGI